MKSSNKKFTNFIRLGSIIALSLTMSACNYEALASCFSQTDHSKGIVVNGAKSSPLECYSQSKGIIVNGSKGIIVNGSKDNIANSSPRQNTRSTSTAGSSLNNIQKF